MNARDVEAVVLEIAPLEYAMEGDPTGLLYGDPETEITGVAVTWTPTVQVLREAAVDGLNFVLTHELPFFSSRDSNWFRTLPEDDRPHNRARRRILDDNGMVVCRCHSNWDGTPGGVMDSCAEALGFEDVIEEGAYCKTYAVDRLTVAELADHAKLALGVPQVRVAGDPARLVTLVTVMYGGLLQQWHGVDEAVLAGADAIVCGEALDYASRAAVDAEIALIETAHVNSENPGLREFARRLAGRLPDLPVRFIDAGLPWRFF
ncbi:MAG: Nif3-like dinuclear metal center hexameric protein [Armatimonadota bacterium]|jgi:putative NIF3 family GTP cyclohydrolase 1 type 2